MSTVKLLTVINTDSSGVNYNNKQVGRVEVAKLRQRVDRKISLEALPRHVNVYIPLKYRLLGVQLRPKCLH